MLTKQELKEHFELFPCPNKEREFKLGNWYFVWQVAQEYWATADVETQTLHRQFIEVSSLKTVDGAKFYKIILWKLSIGFWRIDQ